MVGGWHRTVCVDRHFVDEFLGLGEVHLQLRLLDVSVPRDDEPEGTIGAPLVTEARGAASCISRHMKLFHDISTSQQRGDIAVCG